jgi:hypothetical protein
MQLTEMEYVGISAGLGAMATTKRIRRLQEGEVRVPKNLIDKDQEIKVGEVNKYFDSMKTEVADEG